MRITPSHWRALKFVLPYICRGPWIESNEKRERAVKITFDYFLRPAIEATRSGLCIRTLICHLPASEANPITRAYDLSHVHKTLSAWAEGYTSESEREVDLENNDREFREQDETLMFLSLM